MVYQPCANTAANAISLCGRVFVKSRPGPVKLKRDLFFFVKLRLKRSLGDENAFPLNVVDLGFQ